MERDVNGVDKGEEGSYASKWAGEEDDAQGQVLAGGRAAMAQKCEAFIVTWPSKKSPWARDHAVHEC